MRLAIPYIQDHENDEFEAELAAAKKMRIMMRGVKIGKKRGGSSISIMSVYEKKKA